MNILINYVCGQCDLEVASDGTFPSGPSGATLHKNDCRDLMLGINQHLSIWRCFLVRVNKTCMSSEMADDLAHHDCKDPHGLCGGARVQTEERQGAGHLHLCGL